SDTVVSSMNDMKVENAKMNHAKNLLQLKNEQLLKQISDLEDICKKDEQVVKIEELKKELEEMSRHMHHFAHHHEWCYKKIQSIFDMLFVEIHSLEPDTSTYTILKTALTLLK